MLHLGWLLRNGDGVTRSEADAVRWFRAAADRGNASAEESLGEGYMKGLGGRAPDYRTAAEWFERAASKGDGVAQINLGLLYLNGWGVERDMRRAQSLFVKATLSPEPQVMRAANENLSAMLHHGPPARDRDDTTAAVVGGALVALALLAIFSRSSESSGGSGSGDLAAKTFGGAPYVGSPSTSAPQPVTAFRGPPPPRPMAGNIFKIRSGEEGRNPPVVGR
jgi:TPR repeat protein